MTLLPNQDPHFFVKAHSKIGEGQGMNCTTVRLLHYPPVTELKPNQVRCGEHTDYGSITLLFQDESGGLEVIVMQTSHVCARNELSFFFRKSLYVCI